MGETARLYTRLAEHWSRRGSHWTAAIPPRKCVAVYKVVDADHPCAKSLACDLEREVTLMLMKSRGAAAARGARYLADSVPDAAAAAYAPTRPLCDCGVPCEVAGRVFECARKANAFVWGKLRDAGRVSSRDGPCTFSLDAKGTDCIESTYRLCRTGPRQPEPATYAFREPPGSTNADVLDALVQALARDSRVCFDGVCGARNCRCYDPGSFYDAAAYGLHDGRYHAVLEADPRASPPLTLVSVADKTRRVAVYIRDAAFFSPESPGAPYIVVSAQDVRSLGIASDPEFGNFVKDHGRCAPNCGRLDKEAERLPRWRADAFDHRGACVSCGDRKYSAVRVDGSLRQLCERCADQ